MVEDDDPQPSAAEHGPWYSVIRIAGICLLIVGLGFAGHPILEWLER